MRIHIQHLVRAAVLLLAAPIGAAAQTEGVHLFVDGGPLVNHDMTWGQSVVTTAGGTLGGGIHLGPHSEIRLIVDLPASATVVSGSSLQFSGTPPVPTASVTVATQAQNRSVSVAFAWLIPGGGRWSVTPSVGYSSSHRADALTITTTPLPSGTPDQITRPASGRVWGGILLGAGVVVRATSHLALVPEVRAISYPTAENGGTIVRGAFSARWMF
jgi:hypothetical protein